MQKLQYVSKRILNGSRIRQNPGQHTFTCVPLFRMRLPCSRRSYCGKPSSRLTGWPRLNSGFLQVPTQGRSLSHVATSEHVGNQTAPSSDSAHADVMVIGSMSVDLTCTVPTTSWSSMHMYGSHITKISSSAGGVAHNVALATSYASSSSVRLVTAVGSDPEGQWLREYVKTVGLDVDFIRAEGETARYIAVQDGQGQTVVNFADMSVIEGFNHEDLRMKIRNTTPKFLAFDGYVSPSSVKTILEECGPQTKGTISETVGLIISSFRAGFRAASRNDISKARRAWSFPKSPD